MRKKEYANLCICKRKQNPKQNMPADGNGMGIYESDYRIHSHSRIRSLEPKLPMLNGWKTRPTDDVLSVRESAQFACIGESERQRSRAIEWESERAAAHGADEWFLSGFFVTLVSQLVLFLFICRSYVFISDQLHCETWRQRGI